MECNKEEAIRAREIAEKKMQNKDFVGARRIALKAQQLYPDLENISQMLTVCDVHCSAEHKVFGSEMNWYGILQIEQTADEASIKKQYRKLALLLHPDKNKFAGAEAAFKLIGEVQRLLSDQQKRVLYDFKFKHSLRTAAPKQPARQVNRNPYVRKEPEVQKNSVNIGKPQFTGFTPHWQQQQQNHSGFPNGQQTFWTLCTSCGMRYQYYRNIENRVLRCQSCTKSFTAYDIEVQGTHMGANQSGSVFSQQKDLPGQGAHKLGPQSTVGNFPSSVGGQENFGSAAPASKMFPKTGSTSEVGGNSETKGKEGGDVDKEVKEEGRKRPTIYAEKPEEMKPSGDRSRKRGRKLEEESSESCDTGSSIDTVEGAAIAEDGVSAGQNSGFTGGRYPRRSSRQKDNVTYNENLSEDGDFSSPPKRSRENASFNATEERSKEVSSNQEVSKTDKPAGFAAACKKDAEKKPPCEESLPNGNNGTERHQINGKEAATVDGNDEMSNVDDDSKSHLSGKTITEPEFLEYPDPDFSDFDKDRKEECFAVDQIWAIYDTIDGMPRFYARIRKVFSPGFKLQITWLEPDPDDQDEIEWTTEDLPVACGKFKLGNTENTEDRLMFSHLIFWGKGNGRGSYKIYPRKGETWALFKNWDIKWNSDPDNHRKYEFDLVEVLSKYDEDAGISVMYLGKVKGFVSLFRKMIKKGMGSFQIPPNELFRFSHKVPSFRMTGREREDVPEGSFELDPASLLSNLEEFSHFEDVKMDVESKGSRPKSLAENVEPMMGSSMPNMQKNSMGQDENNALESGNSESGSLSSMELNCIHKKANANQCANKEKADKHLNSVKNRNCDGFTRVEVGTSQADEERPIVVEDTSSDSVAEDPSSSPALSPEPEEIPETEFYHFEADKSYEKFRNGQIWALYSDKDGMPKYYARITKINSPPDFKLYITWLEACSPPKDRIQWLDQDMPVCCGVFELSNDDNDYDDTTTFSHQLKAVPTGKNKYDIYPRKGEVWALYKCWNAKWTCSDLSKCKHDIVEVVEDIGSGLKVQALLRVDGYNSVFKAEKKGGSAVTMKVPLTELLRFSHQIPAFRLTGERGGSLRGFWELDPAALPPS